MKPANILIKQIFDPASPPNTVDVQICDFGIGLFAASARLMSDVGTPGYIPPEAYVLNLLNTQKYDKNYKTYAVPASKNLENLRKFGTRVGTHTSWTNFSPTEDVQMDAEVFLSFIFFYVLSHETFSC